MFLAFSCGFLLWWFSFEFCSFATCFAKVVRDRISRCLFGFVTCPIVDLEVRLNEFFWCYYAANWGICQVFLRL